MKQPPSNQDIVNCLSTNYGIQAAELKHLRIGADRNALVYKAKTHDQSPYFIKLKSGQKNDSGLIILTELHEAGIQEIIPPIKTKNGETSCLLDELTMIVYPFIQGRDGFACNLTDNQWMTLGRVLREIHSFKVPAPILSHLRREIYSNRWRIVAMSLYNETDLMCDKIALKFLKFIKRHQLTIQRLVDRSEELSQEIQKLSPDYVLCHSDIHGGNVIVADNNKIYIVDWDEPILAPKERDLMFIGGGVGNVWNKPGEEELFYRGYGKTKIRKEILVYYRHERIVEDIAEYGENLLLTNEGGKDREIMYGHFVNMFKPQGVIDIAFKTDETL